MFAKSHRISGLFIAPGNAGTDDLGENLPDFDISDPEKISGFCRKQHIDYVFSGTEASLLHGIADHLRERGISVFGASGGSLRLERERSFGKEFMKRYGIPSVNSTVIRSRDELTAALASRKGKRIVMKEGGRKNNRYTYESTDTEKLTAYGLEVLKEDTLFIEESFTYIDLSVFALTDGTNHLVLPPVADYKRTRHQAEGFVTNGMGAICPVPSIDRELKDKINRTIISPTFKGMQQEGLMYKGVLFFSIAIVENEPKLLEYRLRFGDPEAQVLLPLIRSDFSNIIEAIDKGSLDSFPMEYSDDSAVGVVIAGSAYPAGTSPEASIAPIPAFPEKETLIFHGATRKNDSGRIIASGGRSLTVVGLGKNIVTANTRAYEAVKRVSFEGAWHREDIGNAFFHAASNENS
jgi:phosphoribosylamine---glycine ligase